MRGTVRTPRERLSRSEPFEIFTRPQRSRPARLLGLVIRWRAELVVAAIAVSAWLWLTDRMPAWVAGIIVTALALGTAAWPRSRRYVLHRCYAVMTRHRLRAACRERRIMNYSGNLPLQLWSRPTPVGERVWLLLRAGIDAGDLERNLSHLASACWAADARIAAHRKVTALVTLDIVRRDPLVGAPVASPHSTPVPVPVRLHAVPEFGGGRSA
ncbi:hypothetical protein [Pseudonocardia abyssalis]|uniref:Uncharacterized protein n=1 Tax=Pseudonocardia abyssalis TaxID=2792008 RepID=A0ABS6ULP3_9PSEU|nr:hypothetical protein [Pseudonocardia abyssalis]MBW0116497.1 hypothetical protein [Pseudonocardia abyssalis]MBW0132823.1 hypothetical protein [Pseudonocardia abyssalis]